MSEQIFGASWYVLSIQRQHQCWSLQCKEEMNATHSPSCNPLFLDCNSLDEPERHSWLNVTKVLSSCDAQNDYYFQFGIFADAFTNEVASSNFIEKYFYCLWWGLRNLRYCLSNHTFNYWYSINMPNYALKWMFFFYSKCIGTGNMEI